MSHIEARALAKVSSPPFTYCRYIDDIFVDVCGDEQIEQLKQELEDASVLSFTIEKSVNNQLPFLDVAILEYFFSSILLLENLLDYDETLEDHVSSKWITSNHHLDVRNILYSVWGTFDYSILLYRYN